MLKCTTAITVAGLLATGMVFANSADAAPQRGVWDRVASCESTQRWHINTGNGYYGGLQFSASTWAAYGGHRYASTANLASRAEQIEVARRVLASQGPHAWPVCGPRAGLTSSSGGATRAALPGVGGQHHAVRHHAARHHAARHHAARHHAARHHAARHHAARHHAARHHAARHHAARHHAVRHHATYRVHRGDTLNRIAHRLHVGGGWRALYRANRGHLHNPDVLRIGQVLQLH
jgi:hypothetical protein